MSTTRCVDEEPLERKVDYIRDFGAQLLVTGSDWEGKFDEFRDCYDVIYLPRTPSISNTAPIEKIRE